MDLYRDYRLIHRQKDLTHFQVMVKETDLDIAVRKERYNEDVFRLAENLVKKYRGQLEGYIAKDPGFQKSLSPYQLLTEAPDIVVTMAESAAAAGVGPMAAVAGALAESIGKELLKLSRDVIIENGGDIFLRTRSKRTIGIYAGKSPFSHRLGIEIAPGETPLGICTSSGTVGHSLSFGCADAVVILAPSTPLADAVATATGNIVNDINDLEKAVEFATSITGVLGAVVILGDNLAVKGKVKLSPL